MKRLIEKMSKGNIDYNMPVMLLSDDKIDVEMEPDAEAYGEFTVSSADNREIKGIVYSENEAVTVITDQFAGKKSVVKYKIYIKNGKPEQNIDGHINIVSNAGSAVIPYHIHTVKKTVTTNAGKIGDIEQFTGLVQTNYEEAFKIFFSDKFKKCIIKDDMQLNSVYDGLSENWNRDLSIEEFLIAAGMKSPVVISLDRTYDEYENLEENISGLINIKKSGWGYTDISAETTGDFLYNCRNRITQDNFAGNNYEYEYLINTRKLHKGVNEGKIVFSTYSQRIEFDIVVLMPVSDTLKFAESKKYIDNLMRQYLLFRVEKITAGEWLSATEKLVNKRLEQFPKDYLSMLIKAQVMLSTGRGEDAGDIITEAGNVIIPNRQSAIELYCYYLYIKTLQKNNPTFTSDIKKEIRDYYENGNDSWELLWLLLYIDDRYRSNNSLVYAVVKEQFGRGITSPMLYFEALKALNGQPELLRVLNKFEIQLMAFGSRHKYINGALKEQFLEILNASKVDGKLIFNILDRIYDEHPDNDVLESVCGLLIRQNITDKEYFIWYDRAVRAGLNITKLYEFYMYSIDKNYKGELAPAIYMYFNYNADTIVMQKDFLYCNIIENKEKRPSTYDSYRRIIENYAMEQIRLGNMNDYLRTIYTDVLYDELVNADTAHSLSAILNTYRICCANRTMREVTVYHKESVNGETVKLDGGAAYVCVYTKDPVIVFTDNYGNRYCGGIEYTIEKLMDNDGFLDKCLEFDGDNEYLLLHYAEKYMADGDERSAIEVFSKISDWNEIGGICKRLLIKDIIRFYSENYDGNILDDYIKTINMAKLDADARDKVMDIMVLRGDVDMAVENISIYGYEGINPARLCTFCSRRAETTDFKEDRLMTAMCAYVFRRGHFDGNILKYLSKYYYGTTESMYAVWKQCAAYEISAPDFEEKIIAQMLFERNCKYMDDVFLSYVSGGGAQNIKNAALAYYAFEAFIRDVHVPYEIYGVMGNELAYRNSLPDICKIAFLSYASDLEDISDRTKSICKKLIYEFGEYNINLGFFRKFNRWFELPANILDKTVFDCKAEPSDNVVMKYRYAGSGKWTDAEMSQVYPGVFVSSLLLFYGDEIEYAFIKNDGDAPRKYSRYKADDKTVYNNQSRFGMINGMIICNETDMLSPLIQMAKTYTVNKEVADKLFKTV